MSTICGTIFNSIGILGGVLVVWLALTLATAANDDSFVSLWNLKLM